MSMIVERVFMGLTMMMAAASLIPLFVLNILRNDEEDYSTLIFFLGIGALSVFLMSVFLNLLLVFGLNNALNINVVAGIYVFGVLVVFSFFGTLWQIYEYSEIRS